MGRGKSPVKLSIRVVFNPSRDAEDRLHRCFRVLLRSPEGSERGAKTGKPDGITERRM